MAYQPYRLAVFLYVVLLFISAPVCYSQQNSFDKQGNLFSLVNNKVDSLLANDFILMNARFHINKYPRVKGKPFFEATYDTPGKLVLGKKEYNDIRLMYNIYDQKLSFVVEQKGYNGTILELNNQVITRFHLDNKIFVNSFELPILPQTGFYEEIFLGKHLKVYARWSKDYVESITMQNIGEFTSQKRKLFFEINGKMVDISSRKMFLKIFEGERNKIKSFMKGNKIRLFKSNNIDLIKLFSFTDSFL